MHKLKVAAIQLPFDEGSTFESFCKKTESKLAAAYSEKAKLAVLPELLTLELIQWNESTAKEDLKKLARDITPLYFDFIKKMAKQFQMSILGGTSPVLQNQAIKNVAILTDINGSTYFQEKIFLTPEEKKWEWSSGNELKIFETSFARVVIAICFDCEFPLITQTLSKNSPEIILVPSWTGSRHGLNRVDWTARARSIEHFSYVIKTGTVPGKKGCKEHFGQARIISPQDEGFPSETVFGKENQDQIIYANLEIEKLRVLRKISGYIPAMQQRDRKVILS